MKGLIKFILLLFFMYLIVVAFIAISKIQKLNDYNRCVSVMSAAVATGSQPRNTNIHNKCKRWLQ